MVRIGEEREFSGTYVLHWEATRFEWRTGRRRFFGLFEEKINCQLEFPEGLRTPFFDAFGGTAPADWRSRPGLVFNVRFRGIPLAEGSFGHRGWFRLRIQVLDLIAVREGGRS